MMLPAVTSAGDSCKDYSGKLPNEFRSSLCLYACQFCMTPLCSCSFCQPPRNLACDVRVACSDVGRRRTSGRRQKSEPHLLEIHVRHAHPTLPQRQQTGLRAQGFDVRAG